ncbi:MAG: pyridoxine 5'-phosphate synthase [Deltaproteobacteria bacterium]|nr:pyridoxine 5'-phosphate synthase [Deltaproteobacteria bacterium]
MAGLAVNVDHVATLRQARKIKYPDPVTAAVMVEMAGADGVVVHLREDRRHIQDRDVRIIRDIVQTKMIFEMGATDEMIGIALDLSPDLVTLVPEKREELTTEGGLDLISHGDVVASAVGTLKRAGIRVSIFIDPDPDQVKCAKDVDADVVEIHTGAFCDAPSRQAQIVAFEKVVDAAKAAHGLGLEVNAGHGLGYETIKFFKGISIIDEFSIGHSIISRSVFVGIERAVKEMAALIKGL